MTSSRTPDRPIQVSPGCYQGQLARRIRHGRKRLVLSVEEAAECCGLTVDAYSHAEHKGAGLTLHTLLNLADGLRLDRDWLLLGFPTLTRHTPTGWSPWQSLDPNHPTTPAYKLILELTPCRHPLNAYLEEPEGSTGSIP
jgi:transcriptional regulator with XRE-family HTH domain